MSETETGAVPTCYRHPGRETYVRCTRCERPICPDCMTVAAVGFQCPECVRSGNRGVRPARGVFGGRVVPGAPTRVTLLLVLANVVVFALTAAGGTSLGFSGGTSSLYRTLALQPAETAVRGEYYRLLTAMFVHYGVMHVLFNMLALYYVGTPLERALGRARYLAVYLVAGLGGSVAAFVFGPVLVASAGASGAIFGLFGAFFVLARRSGANTSGILGLIAVNLLITFAVPNIAVQAHIGGLVAGSAAAAVIAYAPRGRWRTAVQAGGLAVLAAVLAVAVAVRAPEIRHMFGL